MLSILMVPAKQKEINNYWNTVSYFQWVYHLIPIKGRTISTFLSEYYMLWHVHVAKYQEKEGQDMLPSGLKYVGDMMWRALGTQNSTHKFQVCGRKWETIIANRCQVSVERRWNREGSSHMWRAWRHSGCWRSFREIPRTRITAAFIFQTGITASGHSLNQRGNENWEEEVESKKQ